jgi:hypothetical protein
MGGFDMISSGVVWTSSLVSWLQEAARSAGPPQAGIVDFSTLALFGLLLRRRRAPLTR